MVSVLSQKSEIQQKFLDVMSTKEFSFIMIPKFFLDEESKNIIQKQIDVDEAIKLASKIKSYNQCVAKSTTTDGISFFYL